MSTTTNIHPTALVDQKAEIDTDVTIGPYCIIEGKTQIGAGTRLDSNVHIFSGTTIGKNNHFSHGVVLGCLPQHLTFDQNLETQLIIGDNNSLREYCNLSRSSNPDEPTRIGNHNYFMGNTHAGHDCVFGNNNVITQGAVIGGHVTVGNNIFISGLVAIHQFCRIGNFAMIGGSAKITLDVPPFMMIDDTPAQVTGINLVGLRRAGFDENRLRQLKNAFKKLFRAGNLSNTAIAELKNSEPTDDVKYLVQFIEESKRGTLFYKKPGE